MIMKNNMEIINHECYVSLEVAKLLKEAGFDWECREYYPSSFMACRYEEYAKPTLEVAQRWLREVMKMEVFVEPFVGFYKYAVEELKENGVYSDGRGESYEEAQEAGIKKALEIILEKGK